jgi:transcription elongation factor Elf1
MTDGLSTNTIECPRCGKRADIVSERDRLVFYACTACGVRGAYSVERRPEG